MHGSSRTLSVLFTDVVGSTQLMLRPGSAADELRATHFADLQGALTVHSGREVKTLGDGVMAVFDSATDAVACAVTMQQQATRLRIRLRVGISAGDVTCTADDYFGQPVVEASRLCDAAGAGGVLVAGTIRGLLGQRGIHRLTSPGELHLKGLAEPVVTWNVEWSADSAAIRVALADDSVLLREGIGRVLVAEGFDVVAQASTGDELLNALPGASADVVLVDVRMPPTFTDEGLRVAELVRSRHPGIGVLVLSQSVDAAAANRILSGVTDGVGYLLKERIGDVAELTRAIRTVASGGSVFDPEVVERLGLSRGDR